MTLDDLSLLYDLLCRFQREHGYQHEMTDDWINKVLDLISAEGGDRR